ncbi:MAG: hypothetical protein M3495_08720 [Pseudomonadota bacterium]|nr:hypothetical protein [Gammaproteobacteria bacterium]MDQ3581676.1 hypothetical protein [Pseudomonadota bacterium]
MKPINTPIAIRLEFVGFDDPPARGLSGTERAARSLLRRRLAGAKRIEAVLKPEAAKALADLRTGRTYSAIIEGLLLAEHVQDLRRAG